MRWWRALRCFFRLHYRAKDRDPRHIWLCLNCQELQAPALRRKR